MNFDYLLINYIGEFGLYQIINFILVSIPCIFPTLHSLSWTFTGISIPQRCLLIGENDTSAFPFIPKGDYSLWLRDTFNKTSKNSSSEKLTNTCIRIKGYHVTDRNLSNEFVTEACLNGYRWDMSEMTNAAVKKWEFVCNRKWLKSFVQSVFFIGQFFGSGFFGILGDKIGRRRSFVIAIAIEFVCGTVMAYVPWWPLFAMFRLGLGFASAGIFLGAVVIAVELVGPKYRVFAILANSILFSIGEILLGTSAYIIRDYQLLQLVISVPAMLFLIYWWMIPESARWLVSHRKIEKAHQILRRMAKNNKKQLPDNWHKIITSNDANSSALEKRKYNFFDLFKTPNIRVRTLVSYICWPTVSMSFYGLAMNPNFLGGDRYLSFIMGGVLDIVAIIIVLLLVNNLGRKLSLFGGFLLAASGLFSTLVIPSSLEITLMVLVIVSKMILVFVFATLYVYTPELYPTVIRSTAMGVCSMTARMGGILASYISFWLADISPRSVAIIFGISCIVSACSVLLLPETAGQHQLETLEQAEEFGKSQTMFGFHRKRQDNNANELSIN